MSKHGSTRQSFHFQFITTPTSDTPGTALYLHFDNKRYIFGRVSEGTQRACIQRGFGLKKISNIFITGKMHWPNHGGLTGMILTMADVQAQTKEDNGEEKRSPLGIHGGPKLMHFLACARRFVFRTGMPLDVHETFPHSAMPSEQPSWSDENVQVWAIPVESGTPEEESPEPESCPMTSEKPQVETRAHQEISIEEAQGIRRSIISDMFDSGWRKDRLVDVAFSDVKFPAIVWLRDRYTKQLTSVRCESMASIPHLSPNASVQVRNPWPASLIGELPSASDLPPQTALSYVVRGHPQRGRFDPKKAIKLGVRPGPAFGILAEGNSVELENGAVITPEMVLEPGKPGRGIAIIDLPGMDWLENLVKQKQWTSPAVMDGVEAVVWITDRMHFDNPHLQQFMKSMPGVQHIVASEDYCPDYLAMDSSAASAVRLSRIWPEVFPVPRHDNRSPAKARKQRTGAPDDVEGSANSRWTVVPAERGLKIQIEPVFEVQRHEIVPFLNTAQSIRDLPEGVLAIAHQALDDSVAAKVHGETLTALERDIEVITLGTGSAVPSKYRNVSATLLRVAGLGNYLFDCGENTLGQLRRLFDPEQMQELLSDLRLVWISHLHADHHLGTLSLLNERQKVAQQRLRSGNEKRLDGVYVVGEENMIGFLKDISSTQHNLEMVVPIIADPINGLTFQGQQFEFKDTGAGIRKLESCAVSHCWGAQAVSVTFQNGFKFSYSGDCRPSEGFAKIGTHSDVLVHEATFDDGMEGDAMAKKHCTTAEALAVGARMGAKNVILTHFSQRYQKIPVMSDVKLPKYIRFEEGERHPTEIAGPVDENMTIDGNEPPAAGSSAADIAFLDAVVAQSLDPDQPPPVNMNFCVAFDYMRIKVPQIKEMQRFTPALQALFDVESKKDYLLTPHQTEMTQSQRNQQINRKKTKHGEQTEPRNDDKIQSRSMEQPTSKGQMKKIINRARHEENMRNGGEQGKGKRAKMDGQTSEDLRREQGGSQEEGAQRHSDIVSEDLSHQREAPLTAKETAG